MWTDGTLQDKLVKVGLVVPKIVLPQDGIDLTKWAVVACDQYTSEPEYWQKVEELVGEAPSTLRLVLPEAYLEADDKVDRISKINESMKSYLENGVVTEKFAGWVAVERQVGEKVRRGLVVAIDLEKYDYHKGAKTLIRATEGTIESRIPPRLEIRSRAMMEFPHIMVLIDDPEFVVDVLSEKGGHKQEDLIYDFELMMGGGRIRGWKITDSEAIGKIADNLAKIISSDGLLYAMGDGNHSLATAKAHWQAVAKGLGDNQEARENHSARYALVELVNVHDSGLEFEPIHRWLMVDEAEVEKVVGLVEDDGEEVEMITRLGKRKIRVKNKGSNLAVGNLQLVLDEYMVTNLGAKIDYIHGESAVEKLVEDRGGIGWILPPIKKEELFRTVEKDGALPRKTFSMGLANEKRFYLEGKIISENEHFVL